MEYDELICTQCNSKWKRLKARGRKPKLCPTCLQESSPQKISEEQDSDIDIPVLEEPPPEPTKYKSNSKWICKSCQACVKVGVGINNPPTHACKKRGRRNYPLELMD